MSDDPRRPDPEPAWMATVRRRLGRWLGPEGGASWVVAVSGGGDSVGLLRALHGLGGAFGLRLTVAHLDHGVRGEEAREDARFVAALAGSLGLPFEGGSWSPAREGNFEADARRARYAWLAEVALRRGASAVAVGHTRDDQAETVLHRIVRGTGLRGLAGIPDRRPLAPGVELVRPLLDASSAPAIVAVNSLLSLQPEPHMVCTSAARAGVQNLLKSLASEFAPRIRVNTILLGLVDSGQWQRRFEARPDKTVSREQWFTTLAKTKHIPLARLGVPDEPARAIVFLGSPAASYITGASLEISGGVSRFI